MRVGFVFVVRRSRNHFLRRPILFLVLLFDVIWDVDQWESRFNSFRTPARLFKLFLIACALLSTFLHRSFSLSKSSRNIFDYQEDGDYLVKKKTRIDFVVWLVIWFYRRRCRCQVHRTGPVCLRWRTSMHPSQLAMRQLARLCRHKRWAARLS